MSNVIITGAQWGDEGKGKIVDFLTESADMVVRGAGGNNAGHTVIKGGQKYVLHLVPSGILWEGKSCVIGNGVVMDPVGLNAEIDKLAGQGISITPQNLAVSDRAHLVMPYHRGLDQRREILLAAKKIGTTGRGIGPAYADKVERRGFRFIDVADTAVFTERLSERVAECNELFRAVNLPLLDAAQVADEMLTATERLAAFRTNTTMLVYNAVKAGKSLLFEGAQGTYLDIDHGTYPFVTSSNTTAGGAITGTGAPLRKIDRVVGVCKAYTTRVGAGPFVTENDELGDRLHNMGREFGATTGRPRRCGWLDAVLVRYAGIINGLDDLAVTNLDGLDGVSDIKVCTAYELDGERITEPPATVDQMARCQPVYESLPGWNADITAARRISDLPKNARAYLDGMSELTGLPVSLVGVGPDREQTLVAH
ncbi:MAG TPA: adenylosuccinate synthase [Verrucomicrobiales bacterium]|nr:adenylosuccinate synthase [Verrucomicrobiales bacterium]